MAAELKLLERGESQNCVAVLEDVLADAKAGKVVAVGVVAVMATGGITRQHAGDAEGIGLVHLLGGVSLLDDMIRRSITERGG